MTATSFIFPSRSYLSGSCLLSVSVAARMGEGGRRGAEIAALVPGDLAGELRSLTTHG